MNREQIVRNVKREMKRWVDQIDETNYITIKENIDKYYGLMDALSALPESPSVVRKPKKAIGIQETVELTNEVIEPTIAPVEEPQAKKENQPPAENDTKSKKERKSFDVDKQNAYIEEASEYYEAPVVLESEPVTEKRKKEAEKPLGYVMERKLRGGVLHEIEAFVPEGIVRRLGLEHGDLVHAEKITDTGSRNKYHYTLVESRQAGDAPGRKQMDYCLVEKEAGQLVVKASYMKNEFIRYNDVRYSIIVSESDINYFGIKEGDLVDIAYLANNPAENKILWLHDTEFAETTEEKTERKRKSIEPVKEMSEAVEQTLAGTHVLIVGNESSKASYQAEIEKRGGTFLWADASKRSDSYPSLVRKCTFSIFLAGLSGHTGMKQFKQLCKDLNKPFLATFDQGVTSVIRSAEELATGSLERQKETV